MGEQIVDELLSRLEDSYETIEEDKEKLEYAKRMCNEPTGSFETLSVEFDIPLKVGGLAIKEGTFNGMSYSSDLIKENMDKMVDAPLTIDHPVDFKDEQLKVMDKVGKVTDVSWNEEEKGIDWEGVIVDEELARRVFHGLADSVSIGVAKESENNEITDIQEFKELSIVANPACKECSIEVLSKVLDSNNQIKGGEDRMSEEENQESAEKEVEQEGAYPLFIKKGDEYIPVEGGYPSNSTDESEEEDTEVLERIESLESAVKKILGSLEEIEQDEEETDVSEELEDLPSEEDIEGIKETTEELQERVEQLENIPEEPDSSVDSSEETEQLSEEEFETGVIEILNRNAGRV